MLNTHFDQPEHAQLKDLMLAFCRNDTHIDLEKVIVMNEVVQYMPQIITRHRNTSRGMGEIMHNTSLKESTVTI